MGENSTHVFNGNCFNGSTPIAKIDASADGVNVTFGTESFKEKTSISTLLINGKNSSYTFNGSAFKSTLITEITLGENSSYVFNDCFNGSTKIAKIDASADNLNVTVNNYGFGKASLTTLLINGKNGTYTFNNEAFRGSSITELVLGEGSTYTFNSGCFSSTNNLTKFDASADNLTLTVASGVFSGKSALVYADFSGENSTYDFGENAFNETNPTNDLVFKASSTYSVGKKAFRLTDFASITFEDNCKVTFVGTEAFVNNEKATSLYIGKNIAITNYPFKNLKALETLYIMEGVTNTSEWEFENAGSSDFTTPLYVYNHSTDLSFNKGMFNNCDGIVLYTVTDNIGTRTDVFPNCSDGSGYKAWTVYLGIPHPMVEGLISNPTCDEEGITGWVSDENYCNCGFKIIETKVVNKYENKHNITESTEVAGSTTYEITTAPAWGHDYGVESPVRIDWIYVDNNYFENAKNKHTCTVCGEDYLGKDIENSALFTAKGMTLPENVKDSLGHAIIVNTLAIQAYNEYRGVGNEIKYGVVAGIADASASPVTSSGEANGNAVVAGFENTNYTILQIRINNIDNPTQGLYLSAYVIIDDTVSYLHNGTVNEKAVTVTLNLPNGINLVAEATKVEATVDNKETIYA